MQAMVKQNIKLRKSVDQSYIDSAMSYEEYRRLIDAFIIVGKSTAKNESESLLEYSKLNVVRMNRLDKSIEINPELLALIQTVHTPQTWLVLTEGWCGDAAQIIPLFHKLEQLNPNIQLRLLLL